MHADVSNKRYTLQLNPNYYVRIIMHVNIEHPARETTTHSTATQTLQPASAELPFFKKELLTHMYRFYCV